MASTRRGRPAFWRTGRRCPHVLVRLFALDGAWEAALEAARAVRAAALALGLRRRVRNHAEEDLGVRATAGTWFSTWPKLRYPPEDLIRTLIIWAYTSLYKGPYNVSPYKGPDKVLRRVPYKPRFQAIWRPMLHEGTLATSLEDVPVPTEYVPELTEYVSTDPGTTPTTNVE